MSSGDFSKRLQEISPGVFRPFLQAIHPTILSMFHSSTTTFDPLGSPGRLAGEPAAAYVASTKPVASGAAGGAIEVPLVPEPIDEICWNARYRIMRRLGNGAQGVVYLAHRQGVDGYETQVAVKLYFRDRARTLEEYVDEMRRVARQAMRIGQIQNDNLVTPRDFVSVNDTRVMVMEWVDGLDVRQLLEPQRLERLRRTLPASEWERLNDVVVTSGSDHCRLKPGIAVDVVRGCLAGLSDLHHHGIVHCDLKPSNIMIKRTGTKKIVDIDSSCVPAELEDTGLRGTPYYMAPEQLRDHTVSYASDIASLGYVLIEMLTGKSLFKGCESIEQLLAAKLSVPERLETLLPREVRLDPNLFGLCQKMIAVDPGDRFPDAEAADLDRLGAASFHRKLIKSDLSTEYDRELAAWIESCHIEAE